MTDSSPEGVVQGEVVHTKHLNPKGEHRMHVSIPWDTLEGGTYKLVKVDDGSSPEGELHEPVIYDTPTLGHALDGLDNAARYAGEIGAIELKAEIQECYQSFKDEAPVEHQARVYENVSVDDDG